MLIMNRINKIFDVFITPCGQRYVQLSFFDDQQLSEVQADSAHACVCTKGALDAEGVKESKNEIPNAVYCP